MDNNKSYFYLTSLNSTLRAGVGMTNANLDLRRILGQKYDKFEAFNLSIEVVSLGPGSDSTDATINCFHVEGLPFFNNYYDSLDFRGSSRVLEVVSKRQLDGEVGVSGSYESFTAYSNFLQNIHRVPFYRPATPIIPLFTVFVTNTLGTFYETVLNSYSAIIFSITGIDAYRVKRIPRPIVYRSFNKPNPVLVLTSDKSTSLDPLFYKRRIFTFQNVNWRQVIGTDLYDKYEKFALVTRRMTASVENINFATNFANAQIVSPIYLSGTNLIFETRSDSQYATGNTNALSLHAGMPVIIGISVQQQNRQRPMVNMVDTYVQNVFYRPTQDIGDITINYSNRDTLSLMSDFTPDNTNNTPYPTLVFQFEIIPIVDVK